MAVNGIDGSVGVVSVTVGPSTDVWTELIAEHADALAVHTPGWIRTLERAGRYRDASRFYELSDGRRFILPMVQERLPTGVGGAYRSLPNGWGKGGLLGPDVDAGVVAAVWNDLRSMRAVMVAVKPSPTQAAHWESAMPDDVVRLPRRAHVVSLDGGIDAVTSRLHRMARRNIKRARASNVEIRSGVDDELIAATEQLYGDSIERWAGEQREPAALARFRNRRVHPVGKWATAARELGDDFVLFVAYVDDRPVAVTGTAFGPSAHDLIAAMDADLAGPTRASHLVKWCSIEEACRRGCSALHQGDSGTSSALARIKESFGGEPVDYAEYRLERLPITKADQAVRSGVKRLIGFKEAE